MANYFNCGDDAATIDFWGFNSYSWYGPSIIWILDIVALPRTLQPTHHRYSFRNIDVMDGREMMSVLLDGLLQRSPHYMEAI
jgi:hypothetical protein